MREITASTKYIKMSEVKPGETLITKGKLTEVRPGKFGDTLIFRESNGTEVGLGAGGQLKSLLSREMIKIGETYQVVFKGKKALKDGRTANDFTVMAFDDEQLGLFDQQGDIYAEGLEIE